ncbi:MAG: phosphoglucomutase/phosphomannomutase family protein [Clostridia bacterium]|nr:phosphoglucomutase/phosphomannomutase family protein [Clostridia bacterium]
MIKFGTSGFRGLIGDTFTKENVQRIAQALCKTIKKQKSNKPVVIGFDRRFLSDTYAIWFAEVLWGNKIKTKMYNLPVPSPTVMYTVMAEDLDYGIIITASHNPYDYNGLKITTKGGKDADPECVAEIEKIANTNLKIKTLDLETANKTGLNVEIDNIKDYFKNINKLVSKTSKENNLKVIFNAMHGVTSDYAHYIDKMFKCKKFTIINDSIDPYFGHQLPSPEDNLLEDFKKEVVKGKYSVGLAVDGDGDRLAVIDETGTFHDNNLLMSVAYYYLVKYKGLKGDIVRNISTSCIIDQLAESLGYKCHEVPVGFKYVSAKMKEVDALLGGESSGGMTIRGYIPSKDSFFSIAIILDAMATLKKPLSAIIKEVKDSCGYISTYINENIKISNKKKMQKALSKKSPNFSYKPKEIIRTDGVKYIFEGGAWVLIRFSGTENALRYTLEFPTEIECERNLKAIENFIKQYGK